MRITSARFVNFKAFPDYTVRLEHMNVLVGPNNSGKSTLLGAFRVLSAALRHAAARSPEPMRVGSRGWKGYHLSPDVIPISLENIHTELDDVDSSVEFRLTGGDRLALLFPADGGCVFTADHDGVPPSGPGAFKRAFPITIEQVPVLGPLEHEEPIVEEETVRRSLNTHRASRHFRNYWRYWPEGFEAFAALVSDTWPGMAVQPPERPNALAKHLVMYCLENRITRELYWAGFGFQVWCQLLTHLSRARDASLLVVDEPEIYLHPDLQRQLIQTLRDLGPDILLATHSSEIMADSDPTEIVMVDKSKRTGQRLQDVEGVQAALDAVGSVQNITLTQLARTRRILFVEGLKDFRLLRRFARRMGLAELAAGTGLTPIESGGFSSWEEIRALAKGFETSLKERLQVAAVFDHDYWPPEEVAAIRGELAKHVAVAHIHARKEIENYLITPAVVDRALESAMADRERRTGEVIPLGVTASKILERVTSPMKSKTLARYVARRQEYLRHDRRDDATVAEETLEQLEKLWNDLDSRIALVPGKTVLAKLREKVKELYRVDLTDNRLVEAYRVEEMPHDLSRFLRSLSEFAVGAAGGTGAVQ